MLSAFDYLTGKLVQADAFGGTPKGIKTNYFNCAMMLYAPPAVSRFENAASDPARPEPGSARGKNGPVDFAAAGRI
jgi:hypothetical protein